MQGATMQDLIAKKDMILCLMEQGFVLHEDGFYYNERIKDEIGENIGIRYKEFIYNGIACYKSILGKKLKYNFSDISYYRVLRTIKRDIKHGISQFQKGLECPIERRVFTQKELEQMSTKELKRVIKFWSKEKLFMKVVYTDYLIPFELPGLGVVKYASFVIGSHLQKIQEQISLMQVILHEKLALENYNKKYGLN